MIKLQMLHDYLIDTGLIPAESIQVWMPESETFSLNDLNPDANIMEDIYQVNIEIKNYPFTRLDFRKIKTAFIWWLKVYQKAPKKGQPRFKALFDPETSSSSFIWLGTELSEVTIFEDGDFKTCVDPLIEPLSVLPESLSIWLKHEDVNDFEKLIYGTG